MLCFSRWNGLKEERKLEYLYFRGCYKHIVTFKHSDTFKFLNGGMNDIFSIRAHVYDSLVKHQGRDRAEASGHTVADCRETRELILENSKEPVDNKPS